MADMSVIFSRLVVAVGCFCALCMGTGIVLGRSIPSLQYVQVDPFAVIRLFDLRTSATFIIDALEAIPVSVSWSPDGMYLTLVILERNRYRYVLYPFPSMQAITIVNELTAAHPPSWSRDSQRVAYSTAGQDICILTVQTRAQHCLRLRDVSQPVWSPDDTQLAVINTDRPFPFIEIIDPTGQTLARYGEVPRLLAIISPLWSPDGSKVAFAGQSSDTLLWAVYVIDVNTAEPVRRLTDESEAVFDLAWSPDSQSLAFVQEIEHNRDIYLVQANGSDLRRVTTFAGMDTRPNWSRDGRELVFRSLENIGHIAYLVDLNTPDAPPRQIGEKLAYYTVLRP